MPDTSPGQALQRLSEDDCWALLERCVLGRLAVDTDGGIELFPVNYTVDDARRILFKTSEGTKLAALTAHAQVAFEIDGVDDQTAWSVVVKGVATPYTRAEVDAAERRRIVSWLPTVKSRVVAIDPLGVTGRGFLRGPEPDEDWY